MADTMQSYKLVLSASLAALLIGAATASQATPITPTGDDEVIDVLPALSGSRSDARRQRRQLAQQPHNAALALTAARRYLDQAHALGDPRFAGMAMAAIAAWPDPTTAPDDVLSMRATLQQYLHEFDASAATLKTLLARPGAPRPQAWLTLATVRRVQGRYAESDAACVQVGRAGATLHASACAAENAALRGDVERARATFTALLADRRQPAATRAWLTTSVAELEQRAGRVTEAEVAFREALALDPDPYTTLAYADLLIQQKRPAHALALLDGQVRSDAVLLRLAIAGVQAHSPNAAADAADMRERIALANERPDAKVFHGREQAMFALAVDGDAPRALELARGNVAHQREPLDLLVLAQAARASGEPDALRDAKRIVGAIGLVDRRIGAVL
jgi:tetratricopeptide (TPR) repeat protein